MRTTLDIDDDVLAAAKAMSQRQQVSAGKALSNLARQALAGNPASQGGSAQTASSAAGFRPFASRGAVVSDALVDSLRDAEGV